MSNLAQLMIAALFLQRSGDRAFPFGDPHRKPRSCKKKLTEFSFILHREYRKTDSIVGTDAQYKDDRVAARLLFFTDGLLVSSELVGVHAVRNKHT